MSTAANQFTTPIGRIVQGDAFEPQTKDQQGNALTVKSGPNAGQPTQRYFIAVAFPKTDPQFPALYGQLQTIARAAWPQHFNSNGQCTHPKFSWKLADGDGIDDNGKPNNTKEGFAGHWVLKFSSSFPPRCFYQGRYQPQDVIQDKNAIRKGYFVRVAGTVEGNGNVQKPGLYVNLNMIELVAQGPEIVSGPDAGAAFGGVPVGALPPGATALPTVPPGAGTAPTMPGLPPAAVTAPAMPGLPPATLPVAPNPAFVAGPPVRTMTAKANGYTRDQLIAGGWTDDKLIAEGLMI